MKKTDLIYKKTDNISKDEFESVILSGDNSKLWDSMVSAAFHIDDVKWLQEKFINLFSSENSNTSRLAAICLGHIARIHGDVDKDRLINLIKSKINDHDIGGDLRSAIDDIKFFAKNKKTIQEKTIEADALNLFAEILMKEIRDKTIKRYHLIINKEISSEIPEKIIDIINSCELISDKDVKLIVSNIVDGVIYNLLGVIQYNDCIKFDVINDEKSFELREINNDLSSCLFEEDGWISLYSEYKECFN